MMWLYKMEKSATALVPLNVKYCQTPDLGLGLGVDFIFPNNKNTNKNSKNPNLIFHRREGTRGLIFGTQT